MASVLDHKSFRDSNEALTILHDEWMHSSTGYTNPLNEYQGSPNDMVPQITFGPWDIPPGHSSLGYSPSDTKALILHHASQGNNSNVDSVDSSTSGSGGVQGKQHHQRNQRGRQHQRSGRGGGGTKAAGANALGSVPKLGNVPYSTAPASGTSPTVLLLVLGGGVLVVYFIWHKLRKSKAEDKEMNQKGE